MAHAKNIFICIVAMIVSCIASLYILAQRSKLFHKDAQYYMSIFTGNISDISNSKSFEKGLNESIKNSKWNEIISQRTKMPLKCSNSTYNNNIITIIPESNNWFTYYLRCNYLFQELSDNDTISGELFHSKELNYIHNYKAGGTTIQTGLEKLRAANKLNVTPCHPLQREHGLIHFGGITKAKFLNSTNNDTVIFTFIRDPLQKFLSGFFEAIKRKIEKGQKGMQINNINFYEMDGLQILRIWIKRMLQSISQNRRRNILEKIQEIEWIDFHLVSNHHLMQPVHTLFNFVGNLDNLNNDLPQILSKYILDERLKYNGSVLMKQYFKHQRKRDDEYMTNKVLSKFNIKISDLDDDDIYNICQIYWSDYICFPFEIPSACNITEMFIQHYYRDIEYKSCY